MPRAQAAPVPFTGGWLVYLALRDGRARSSRACACRRARIPSAALAIRAPAAWIRDRQSGRPGSWPSRASRTLLERFAERRARLRSAAGRGGRRAIPKSRRRIRQRFLDVRPPRARVHRRRRRVPGEFVAPLAGPGAAARSIRRRSTGALRAANPSPFAALLRDGDFAVISSSPERLVSVQGGIVSTRPDRRHPAARSLARARCGADRVASRQREGARGARHAHRSRSATISAGSAPGGSVRVDEYMTVESYAHVHHIVSNVSGLQARRRLARARSCARCFPGGTITGCPKVRCMEIIARARGRGTRRLHRLHRLSQSRRQLRFQHPHPHHHRARAGASSFAPGAGIVADSSPAQELAETRAKAEGLLRALRRWRARPRREHSWINGATGTADRLPRSRPAIRRRAVRDHARAPPDGSGLLEYHLERLFEGCRRLAIAGAARRRRCGGSSSAGAALHAEAVLKLIVTRGPRRARLSAERPGALHAGAIAACRCPRAAVCANVPVECGCARRRLGSNPALAGLKTLNRLESVLARAEWRDERIWEGLMRDIDGDLVCGTMSNLFVRRGSTLMTPALDRCGIAGVMRRWVLEQAPSLRLRVLAEAGSPCEHLQRCRRKCS